MSHIEQSPISNVQWIDVDKLQANDYNPNVVFKQEMKLLEFSILTNGWIQPILVTQDYVIIDGFHRATLSKTSVALRKQYNGMCPVVVMNLTEQERMLLTIRINRAKGSHIAVRMSDIVKTLINDYQMSKEDVARQIGATKQEIDLLLAENVFKKLKVAETEYSKAWYPN